MDLLTEKLWNEYFAEECSRLDTNEERELIKKAGKLPAVIFLFYYNL